MANITIEKINYFDVDVTNDNREFDFNANILYRHGKKLKLARLYICQISKTVSLSKDQHGQNPFSHETKLTSSVEIEKGWR